MEPSSSPVSPSKVWNHICQAEASLQCRKLAWRACKDELPVKCRVSERGDSKDGMCPFCGAGNETATHALLLCEEVKRMWFASPLGLQVDSLSGVTSLSQWIHKIASTLDEQAMGLVCGMMWGLWHRRNSWVLLDTKLDYQQVVQKAFTVLIPEEWRPPLDPYVKANFGASVRHDVGTGMGVVYRDSLGAPLAAGTKVMEGECFDPQVAEALCCIWAMELAGELCFSDVIFETECQQFYAKWNQGEGETGALYTSYFDSLVDDCRVMTQGTESSIRLVSHSANRVAQSLATGAFDYGERVWMEEAPDEAFAYIESDVSELADLADHK